MFNKNILKTNLSNNNLISLFNNNYLQSIKSIFSKNLNTFNKIQVRNFHLKNYKISSTYSKIFLNELNLSSLGNCSKNTFTTLDINNSYKADKFLNFNPNSENIKKHVNLSVTNINDNPGSKKLKRRVGRGPGSSKGKTSARGHKIRGEPYRHFEGGQTNVFRRLPKHGFKNKKFQDQFSYINIQKILYLIHKGRIDPTKPIGIREIFYSGGVSKVVDGIKLLSRGKEYLKDYPPLNIIVQSATEKAIQAINERGGSVTISHGTRRYNRFVIKPAKFNKELIEPYPSFKKVRRMLRLKDKGAL